MPKHTLGPWINKPATLNPRDPMFYKADVISGGIRVAHVAGVGEDCANANAYLIAAAPELLETLKDLVYAKETGMGPSAVNLRYDLAKKAIAKATGGE